MGVELGNAGSDTLEDEAALTLGDSEVDFPYNRGHSEGFPPHPMLT